MNPPVPKRAVLVRVGVDQTYGRWNAPCNSKTGDFVYVPIPESKPNEVGMQRTYLTFIDPALHAFALRNAADHLPLPSQLSSQRMHLDPDFDYLTYGDTERRGKVLLDLDVGDFVVFYAGMRDLHSRRRLVYGLIGLLVVSAIRRVASIPTCEYICNAHTRRRNRDESDLVVTGNAAASGRLLHYIDIGEFRNRSYRVRRDLLDAWGGLSVNDGFLQRSANPPRFLRPELFSRWLQLQAPELVLANNRVG